MKGFTLVELMVAVVVGSLLTLGVFQVFQANSQTNRLNTAFSRIQETGRVATELMARDIRMADYWGCLPEPNDIVSLLHDGDDDYDNDASYHAFDSDAIDGLDDVGATDQIGSKIVAQGSDVLTIRTTTDACSGLGKAMSTTNAASLHIGQNCPVEPADVVLITNCNGGDLFSVTNVSPGGGGHSDKVTITHNSGTCNHDGCIENVDHRLSQEYGQEARILKPVKKTFFLAEGFNGTNSLFVKEDNNPALELVDGVDDLQIVYGEDSNSDGAVDRYLELGAIADKDNILSVRVELSVTYDLEVNTKEADKQLYKKFVATSTIRNRAL